MVTLILLIVAFWAIVFFPISYRLVNTTRWILVISHIIAMFFYTDRISDLVLSVTFCYITMSLIAERYKQDDELYNQYKRDMKR